MKQFLAGFEPYDLIFLVSFLSLSVCGIIYAARSPHEYGACRAMAHGNIQAYTECVRAERGNR